MGNHFDDFGTAVCQCLLARPGHRRHFVFYLWTV